MPNKTSHFFAMRVAILFIVSIILCGFSESNQHIKFSSPYDKTLIPKACHDSIPYSIDARNNHTSHFLYSLCVKESIDEIFKTSVKLLHSKTLSKQLQENLQLGTCREFLSLAMYNLNKSLPSTAGALTAHKDRSDFMTWLSAALTDVQTCLDRFPSSEAKDLEKSVNLIIASLSILNEIDSYANLRESSSYDASLGQQMTNLAPTWLSDDEKMLLHGSKEKVMNPSIVVAADGSGKYKTIKEAIAAVPSRTDKRFVIYVKKGVYHENVKVTDDKWNVMIYGDGIGNTIVSGNLNDGGPQAEPESTATFAVYGKGFIAKDIEFQNTAGPSREQAVALFSSSDKSVFYRCRIAGYQDTLLAHSNRQFYRECEILGTIDFIFGDAAAVFQNSKILVRRPLTGRSFITAQGKISPQSKTGFSIQNCTIAAAEDLTGIKTYLGRPWKSYSTIVIMQSLLSDIISPEGWAPWNDGETPPDTILFVEYKNRGPGAVTTGRVKWSGLKVGETQDAASKFTVRSFIDGVTWLPRYGVPFTAGFRVGE